MKRYDDWSLRLRRYLSSVANRPFHPGVHDCGLFFAGGVEAMTGVDIAAEYRGEYSSIEEGILAARRAGYRDHVAVVAAQLEEVPPSFAFVGDGAVVETDQGSSLGIVQGGSVFFAGPNGLGSIELTRAVRAFRVPF